MIWVSFVTPKCIHNKRFFDIKKIPARPGILLDVGANDGVSVLSIRALNKTNPILSLEPNPKQKGRLRLLTKIIKNYEFKLVGAGEKTGKLTLTHLYIKNTLYFHTPP